MTDHILTTDRVEIGKVMRMTRLANYLRNDYLRCTDPKERAKKKREWRKAKRAVEYEEAKRRT